MISQVEEALRCHRLLGRGQRVLVAVSGGLDSMVLLRLLHELAATHRWQLVVAHFNHQLRGRASKRDEALVRRVARRLGWPCVVGHGDVRARARKAKASVEMAARELRHEFLARTARRLAIRNVALAHHADDRVELFFLRLLRGAGCDGLAGLRRANPSPTDPRVRLVRPLFDFDKEALRAFANDHSVPFREDTSNASLDIQRNRVRHELLPLLRRRHQPALDRVIIRLTQLLGDTADYLSDEARAWLRGATLRSFDRLPVALQRAVLQAQLIQLGVAVDYDLIERLRQAPDRVFSLSSTLRLRRGLSGRLVVEPPCPVSSPQSSLLLDLTSPSGQMVFDGVALRWAHRRLSDSGPALPAARPGREFFDADKVGPRIVLRHWQKGDRFQPLGLPHAVKLQDWFTNRKVPRAERHKLLVATTAAGEIWWIEGQRIAEGFKVTPHTRTRLRWEWKRSSR